MQRATAASSWTNTLLPNGCHTSHHGLPCDSGHDSIAFASSQLLRPATRQPRPSGSNSERFAPSSWTSMTRAKPLSSAARNPPWRVAVAQRARNAAVAQRGTMPGIWQWELPPCSEQTSSQQRSPAWTGTCFWSRVAVEMIPACASILESRRAAAAWHFCCPRQDKLAPAVGPAVNAIHGPWHWSVRLQPPMNHGANIGARHEARERARPAHLWFPNSTEADSSNSCGSLSAARPAAAATDPPVRLATPWPWPSAKPWPPGAKQPTLGSGVRPPDSSDGRLPRASWRGKRPPPWCACARAGSRSAGP
mmetsp:Transcript_59244/g.129998  ORF Transcript_59244/g.129998 Transcript_59244/m.129998 type:complete len:307 (-) Transcript_59244:1125-2045(-)